MLLTNIRDITIRPGDTFGTAVGTDEDDNTVTFGGDWRPLRDLEDALEDEPELSAYVEDWQVLSVVTS